MRKTEREHEEPMGGLQETEGLNEADPGHRQGVWRGDPSGSGRR